MEQFKKGKGILVVADPAGPEDLGATLELAVLQKYPKLLVDQARAHTQHLLPHRRDRHRDAAVILRGVVAQLHFERIVFAVAGMGVAFARRLLAFGLAPASLLGQWRRVVGQSFGHQVEARNLAEPGDLAGQNVTVDRQVQRLAQRQIVAERFAGQVEPEEVSAKPGRDRQRLGQVARQPVELTVRHLVGPVQVAEAKALELGVLILDRIEHDPLQDHVISRVIVGVALQGDRRARLPVDQPESAVGDQKAGLDEGRTVFGQRGGVHRIGRAVSQQTEEIGCWIRQPDLYRAVVERLDPECIDRQLSGQNLGRVFDRHQHPRMNASSSRVDRAPEAEHEVPGGNRLAIRPTSVFTQVEGVTQAIAADVPAPRRAWHQTAVRRGRDQTLEQVAQDIGCRHTLGAVRIQRLRLLAVASVQFLGLGQDRRIRTSASVEHDFDRLRQTQRTGFITALAPTAR